MDPQPVRRPGEPRGDRLPPPLQRGRSTRSYPDVQTIAEESTALGAWSRGRRTSAASASATSGTWAGCTTRSSTSRRTRSTASTTRTSSPSGCSTPSTRTSCCRSRTTRSCTARARCWDKMPGDEWQKFANLRALYGYMWGMPGKKLLFMGGEIAQRQEWRHDRASTGTCSNTRPHQGVHATGPRPEHALPRPSRRCTNSTTSPAASSGSTATTPTRASSASSARAKTTADRDPRRLQLHARCRGATTASACPCPGLLEGNAEHRCRRSTAARTSATTAASTRSTFRCTASRTPCNLRLPPMGVLFLHGTA